MKVEHKEGFVPIVITLETKEEAAHLWHRLCCETGVTFEEYASLEAYPINYKLDQVIWKNLDDVYEPREEK